jgi:epoxyqueuosine reductase QueG
MRDFLEALFADLDVEDVSVCAYKDILPLLPSRSAARLPQNPRSVIVCLFPYYVGELPGRNVAYYAAVDDYHHIAGAILSQAVTALEQAYPGHAFIPFVDASPLREVAAARLAGLGDVGRNGLLIHPRYGSFVFIGAIAADIEIPPWRKPGGSCQNCGACLRACPTGALTASGFDDSRCRSRITQKTGNLTPWEEEQIRAGGFVWGCDCCLEACPHTRKLPPTPIQAFHRGIAPVLTLENLEALYPAKPYNYRCKGILRRNLAIIARPSLSS